MNVTQELIAWLISEGLAVKSGTNEYYKKKAADAIQAGTLTVDKMHELTVEAPRDRTKALIKEAIGEMTGGRKSVTNPNNPDPGAVFGVHHSRVRVKNSKESYLTTKSLATHAKTGQPVFDEQGQQCMTVSELEFAKGGAFLKHVAKKSGIAVRFSDHDRDLLEESYSNDRWVGLHDGEWRKDLSGLECKALLSDSTSGGVYVNPEWFDSNLIAFPLLSGELFPLVDLTEVPRGAAVEGASVGNPSVSWGTNSGTATSLFNTDALTAPVNSTIHTITCTVEVGRDFLSDAAADVGRTLMNNIGEGMKKELDNVIANGNGTNRPEGVFTASGVGSVTTGGDALTVSDLESLLFGVGKQYRTSQRCAFLSNDTNYARVRGIAVGASDQRRVFGMDHESYDILKRPWKIQNDTSNRKVAFGDFSRYRMYRRLGITIEMVTTDSYLARANKVMLLARGRFGGRVVDPSAFAVAADCQL